MHCIDWINVNFVMQKSYIWLMRADNVQLYMYEFAFETNGMNKI